MSDRPTPRLSDGSPQPPRLPRPSRSRVLAVMISCFALLCGLGPMASSPAQAAPPADWVGAWTASPLGAGSNTDSTQGQGFDDQTVRNVVHLAAGGEEIRIELSNAYGEVPLHVGAATVAVRTSGGGIDPSTLRRVEFGGRASAVIPEGALLVSDPIALTVGAGADLAVSIHFPVPTGPVTWHQNAAATSYLSSAGDHTADVDASAYQPVESWFFLSEVAVSGSTSRGAVVAFGDSITEGYRTTTDADHRYTDYLNTELSAIPPGKRLTALNAGIGGNRLLTNSYGTTRVHESAQSRFVRDVVGSTGVTTVIATFGTNDLASYGGNADGGVATADDLIRGMKNLINQAHANGLRIMVGTILPFGGTNVYSERTEQVRTDYNTWVRMSGEPDAIADFDAALRDPEDPTRIADGLHSGDRTHPSDAGARAMAEAVDLAWLQGKDVDQPEATDYVVLGAPQAPQPMPSGIATDVTVPVTNELSETAEITVEVAVPEGWSSEPVTAVLAPGEDARIPVPVTAPEMPGSGTITVSATVSDDAALVLGRPMQTLVTAPSATRAALALDFGGEESPLADGYRRMSTGSVDDGSGLGWLSTDGLDWRDRGRGGVLASDFVNSADPATLRITIPAGVHEVYLLTGDGSYSAGRLVVSEGDTRLADTGDKLTAGDFRWLRFSLDGGTSGRTVDLTFTVASAGTWRVNALAVMA